MSAVSVLVTGACGGTEPALRPGSLTKRSSSGHRPGSEVPALVLWTSRVYWLAVWQDVPTPMRRVTALPIGRASFSSPKWMSRLSQSEPSALCSFISMPSP